MDANGATTGAHQAAEGSGEYKPKTVLVTGGAGFIASHVVIRLLKYYDYEVRGGSLARQTRAAGLKQAMSTFVVIICAFDNKNFSCIRCVLNKHSCFCWRSVPAAGLERLRSQRPCPIYS